MNDIINVIANVIGSVGFPIACSCYLLYRLAKNDERNEKQKNELRKTIENNTKSIDKLSEIVKTWKGEK